MDLTSTANIAILLCLLKCYNILHTPTTARDCSQTIKNSEPTRLISCQPTRRELVYWTIL